MAGIVAYIGFTANDDNQASVTSGEHVRLAVLCVTFWGPMYLLVAWLVILPVILALGMLVASFRGSRDVEPATPDPFQGTLPTVGAGQ